MLLSNYYSVLKVKTTANQEEITKAFRKELLSHHPDKNINRREECKARSMEIVEAYHTLSCKDSREDYDKYLGCRRDQSEGHLQLISVKAPRGLDIMIEYECGQCFGSTGVQIRTEELFQYVVCCQHCGLRSRVSVDNIL